MMKTIVVDLDGTLFGTNTFEHYIVFVAKEALKRFDVLTVLTLLALVALRKVRFISAHERMKYHVLRKTSQYANPARMRTVANLLKQYENKKVLALLNKYSKEGYVTVLSTAAPVTYAKFIASDYNISHYCATEMPQGKNWHENVNEQKKENTLRCLKEFDGVLSVLVTDHYDDLPLLSIPKECNYLVNPTNKTLGLLADNHIRYTLL